ncbi:PDZ domain-containing protein [Pedobacter sp. LMG 31464]|uniref:PDZ domain-containing protein n=1 Tax=Pedobacter planticolens TaxID=2679964 RepID=A0A923IWP0_9SPHI|nr:PDZ domain-containing protein [Pedobacter planticolens]MBB2146369.1 PDZ domain-containing protein [Pedobacter planticolens]
MKKIIFAIGLLATSIAVQAQQEISYEVSFPNAIHHEAQISMVIPNVPAGPLKVRMSRSSPGRYATHEFGKNVYNLKAFDANGKSLALNQPAGDIYEIPTHGTSVKITYTLFGNWIDGTYVGFDETHAHMNIPATFAFPIGMDNRPRIVKFNYAEKQNWKVATQLKPMGKDKYYAPNLQYFMDSPTEIADYKTASWEVKNLNGKTQTIHLISHSNDEQKTIDDYAIMLKKMVAEHVAVWGEFPDYDYGNYYFLQDVYPDNAGDGMEHRNSTSIVQRTPKIAGYESGLLGTFSHEYFHSWNVERLRPKGLEPFNFEHANITDGLWVAEGFTQYYGNLLLARAGFRTVDNAAQTFNGLVNAVLNSPGAKNFTPIQASRYAVFADAGVAIDQTNKNNIFTSYYTYGAAVALALDLRLRSDFKLTLDDYMRALWKTYGKTEIAYSMSDLEKTLGQLTKNPAFAADFFKNYVYGTAKNDYAKLLLNAGFVLRKSNPEKAYTGFGRIDFENGKATLGSTTQGTPAYDAGLDIGDNLLTVDGIEIKDQAALTKITDAHKPGDIITIKYTYRGEEKTTKLTFSENPALELISIEKTDGVLTPAMQTFRDNWLNSQVK